MGDAPTVDYALPAMPTQYDVEEKAKGLKPPQLLNFMAEIVGCRSAVKGLIKASRAALKRGAILRKGRSRRNRPNQPGKQASGLYLATDFGLLPTIADIRDTLKMIQNLQSSIRRLYQSEGRTISLRYQLSGSGSLSGTSLNTRYTCDYHFSSSRHLAVKYTLPKGAFDSIQSLLMAINLAGLDKLTSSLWEAVPFSFVIDWFLPIGSALERFDPRVFDFASFTIVDHYVQTRVESGQTVYYGDNEWFRDLRVSGLKVGVRSNRIFIREPVLAALPLFEQESNPWTIKRFATASALAGSLLL